MVGMRNWMAVGFALIAASSAMAECEEVGYIATFDVAAGQEQVFESAVLAAAAKVNEVEEGTIFYAPYKGEDGKYYMLERYRDLAARDVHAKDPAVLEAFGPLLATLAADVDVLPITALCEQAP